LLRWAREVEKVAANPVPADAEQLGGGRAESGPEQPEAEWDVALHVLRSRWAGCHRIQEAGLSGVSVAVDPAGGGHTEPTAAPSPPALSEGGPRCAVLNGERSR